MADATMSERTAQKGHEGKKWEGRIIPGLGNGMFGFPKSIVTKLRYVDNLGFTASAANTASMNVYRANSVFDPDQTGVGHQPMFFDNYAAIYNNYRVLGSKIRVVFSPFYDYTDSATLQSSRGPWLVGINGANTTTAVSTNMTTRAEMNEGNYKVLNARTGADGVVVVEHNYDPESRLGRLAADDVVSSTVTGNPSNAYYWQVWVATTDSTAVTSSIYANVYIEYTVEFFQPAYQSQN